MNEDFIVNFFCQCRGVKVSDIYDIVTTDKASQTRYMIYAYLHRNCHYSSYKLAERFNRTRRSILRSMAKFRIFVQHDKIIKTEYFAIVEKMESAFKENTPSNTMEDSD